jgi:hypothetical protein
MGHLTSVAENQANVCHGRALMKSAFQRLCCAKIRENRLYCDLHRQNKTRGLLIHLNPQIKTPSFGKYCLFFPKKTHTISIVFKKQRMTNT